MITLLCHLVGHCSPLWAGSWATWVRVGRLPRAAQHGLREASHGASTPDPGPGGPCGLQQLCTEMLEGPSRLVDKAERRSCQSGDEDQRTVEGGGRDIWNGSVTCQLGPSLTRPTSPKRARIISWKELSGTPPPIYKNDMLAHTLVSSWGE